MWIFWIIFAALMMSTWRLVLLWRARRANTSAITESSENQASSPAQTHFTHEIEEVSQVEDPSIVDPPSSVASTDPPSSVASPEFPRPNGRNWNALKCTITAGLGGLIVGHLTSVTGGLLAIPNYLVLISRVIYKRQAKSYEDNFCAYRNQWLFLYASSIHFMAVLGIGLAVFFVRCGRRLVLRSGALLLFIGILLMAWFPTVNVEVIGLLFTGFGVGLIHQVTRTIYVESIPKDDRWAIFDWGSIVGSVVAVASNYTASHFHVWGWRMSIGVAGIPSLILLILSYFIIETPQYHIEQNRLEMAKNTLKAMRWSNVEVEFSELLANIEKKQSNNALREMITPPNRPALVITTLQETFGSISGVELLIFYGPWLLETINSTENVEFLAPVILALIQAIAKGVGALCIRQTGRRWAFLLAYFAAIIPLVCLGILFHLNPNDRHHLKSQPATISIAMVVIHTFSNGILSGPYGWIDSRYPEECADLGFTYGHCLSLFTTFVVNQVFLHMLCALREWMFLAYAIWSFLLMCFTIGFIPETTGMTQHNMVRRVLRRHWFWMRYMPDINNVRSGHMPSSI